MDVQQPTKQPPKQELTSALVIVAADLGGAAARTCVLRASTMNLAHSEGGTCTATWYVCIHAVRRIQPCRHCITNLCRVYVHQSHIESLRCVKSLYKRRVHKHGPPARLPGSGVALFRMIMRTGKRLVTRYVNIVGVVAMEEP